MHKYISLEERLWKLGTEIGVTYEGNVDTIIGKFRDMEKGTVKE